MNRTEYIKELKSRLNRLPENEVEEVLKYYEEYFDDVGNESDAINNLGSPASVASQVIANFVIKDVKEDESNKKKGGFETIWIVILAIFASPIAFPIAITVVTLILSLLIVVYALIFSLGVTSIALIFAGVCYAITSILIFIPEFPTALLMLGLASLSGGIGLLLMMGTINLAKGFSKGIAKFMSNFLLRRVKK